MKLLFGSYTAPRLRRGHRATWLNHDTTVIIIGWTDARICWPRCQPIDRRLGLPTSLLDEELTRAVRHESAAPIRFCWGVGEGLVWRGQNLLGVSRTNNEGSARLIQAATKRGGEAMMDHEWTPEDIALVGRLSDREVARRGERNKKANRST